LIQLARRQHEREYRTKQPYEVLQSFFKGTGQTYILGQRGAQFTRSRPPVIQSIEPLGGSEMLTMRGQDRVVFPGCQHLNLISMRLTDDQDLNSTVFLQVPTGWILLSASASDMSITLRTSTTGRNLYSPPLSHTQTPHPTENCSGLGIS